MFPYIFFLIIQIYGYVRYWKKRKDDKWCIGCIIASDDLFIVPPDTVILTDEDSGDEDYGGNIVNFNHKKLQKRFWAGFYCKKK